MSTTHARYFLFARLIVEDEIEENPIGNYHTLDECKEFLKEEFDDASGEGNPLYNMLFGNYTKGRTYFIEDTLTKLCFLCQKKDGTIQLIPLKAKRA